jgi:dTDP-4-dehydrorhamnose 3,5-epimerase
MLATAIPSAEDVRSRPLAVPDGVQFLPLKAHKDHRGALTEIYREEWVGARPVQWNMVRSGANVLRGVHVHVKHVDLLTMISGEMLLGLRDLRAFSPTFGLSMMATLSVEDAHLVVIPPGVAHGFYFARPAGFVYGVTTAFDGSDEFGCQWDDPALELDWPCSAPVLSERDMKAAPLAELLTLPFLRGRE